MGWNHQDEWKEVATWELHISQDKTNLGGDSLTHNSHQRIYEIASGLKINFHKSKLAGINVEGNTLGLFASTLNCTLIGVPFKYLGVVVGGNPRKTSFWESILNKLSDRLSAWKRRFLSLAGRICLVKSVLKSLPLFYLCFFKALV